MPSVRLWFKGYVKIFYMFGPGDFADRRDAGVLRVEGAATVAALRVSGACTWQKRRPE
jgi:hypothetical protein